MQNTEINEAEINEESKNRDAFLESCKEARKIAFSFSDPLVVHHYDADGLSSGALVAAAFLKEGKKFRRDCIKKLDDEAIDRYLGDSGSERGGRRNGYENEIIFVDLGGGNKRVNELKDVLIIDHHQTEGIEKPQANPILFGIDGGTELSASGTAYCVFRQRADLGIVGAVGDMQSPLTGMNRWVLEEGEKSGEVRVEDDIRFYGRYCRPLVQFLAYSDDPYIPGISYREEKAMELLGELGISYQNERKYVDLKEDEKRLLVSALAKIMINSGQLKKVNELIGESYIFPKHQKNETFEANEFSTLLNACGRHSQPDIGVRVCLGDESAQQEARALLQLHRKMLREGMEFTSKHVQDFGAFYFLDGRGVIDEGIIGVVCGMALQQSWGKPIIGIALGENNTIKVSGRAARALVNKGINLGNLMKQAAMATGDASGIGGGHKIAAGASIPREKLNEFLLGTGEFLRSTHSTE